MSSKATISYVYQLLEELKQLVDGPLECRHAQVLLSREITKAWEEFQQNTEDEQYNKQNSGFLITPPPGDFGAQFSSSSFITPIKYKLEADTRNHNETVSGEESTEELSQSQCHVVQTKVYIPDPPKNIDGKAIKCNYIGRILGPSGLTAKQIESKYGVTLLIRGQGSVRDPKKVEALAGKKGFEHLDEPLHVLLIAKDVDRKKCEDILNKAAEKIESLLTPVHDDLKKDQLLRLAVINGTYVQRSPRTPVEGISPNSVYFK